MTPVDRLYKLVAFEHPNHKIVFHQDARLADVELSVYAGSERVAAARGKTIDAAATLYVQARIAEMRRQCALWLGFLETFDRADEEE